MAPRDAGNEYVASLQTDTSVAATTANAAATNTLLIAKVFICFCL
jgi:hypothetical protein